MENLTIANSRYTGIRGIMDRGVLELHWYSQAGKNTTEHTLLLYDGHSFNLSKEVINWALENKIVLFVLPPYTSHLLQPSDVGCYGPFKSVNVVSG